MQTVLLFSFLLIAGLVGSQLLPASAVQTREAVALGTMTALSFIMIHVGFEFEIDKKRPRQYAWDACVAFTAAGLPWLLCAGYFVFAMMPRAVWSHPDAWKESLVQGLFAAPTSAGVLFSMLAAAGLAGTWLFEKARVLAIFDDLGTILLMIPMKIMLGGVQWQLAVVVLVLVALLAMSWFYLHEIEIPTTWPWVVGYAVVITIACHGIYLGSLKIDPSVPAHLEVLLPAFALGCMMKRRQGDDPHVDDARPGHQEGPADPTEQRVATIISAVFMVLVGLSMPSILTQDGTAPREMLKFEDVSRDVVAATHAFPGWGMIAVHVIAITILSNVGKMFIALCYRGEASRKERLAIAIGMFPRGEVGAGVLIVALSYGIAGPALTVAVLSLAVNLMGTGLFILVVKKLLATKEPAV
jgi:Kef-type K+ transport system membrane component KefB